MKKNYPTTYHYIYIEDVNVFYRKAGNPKNAAILLLHGFPSASHMFRDLIPILANDYYLIAPGFAVFGQSDCPSHKAFNYTFVHLSRIINLFVEAIKLDRFAMYLFYYAVPIGFLLAIRHPDRFIAIVASNVIFYRIVLVNI